MEHHNTLKLQTPSINQRTNSTCNPPPTSHLPTTAALSVPDSPKPHHKYLNYDTAPFLFFSLAPTSPLIPPQQINPELQDPCGGGLSSHNPPNRLHHFSHTSCGENRKTPLYSPSFSKLLQATYDVSTIYKAKDSVW